MEGSTFDNKEKPKTLTEKGVEKGGLAVREAESAEESKARFGAAIERMIDGVLGIIIGDMRCQPRYDAFVSRWNNTNVPEHKKGLLETRKTWVEMKRGGKAFEKVLTDRIKSELDSEKYNNNKVFALLNLVPTLGYKDAAVFQVKLLITPQFGKTRTGAINTVY